uniref:Complex III subunit 9 n=1 Tax=Meloidogyne hapla TaxID=6305 RepID=A0A1I8B6V7_MELHA
MGFGGVFYRTVGKRFSTILLFSVGSAIFMDVYINKFGQFIWDYKNYGKQWKDIKHRYVEMTEESE